MQGGRGGRDPFFDFGDPFAGFGSIGGFRGPRSLISNLFSGRNPFDDPFFTRPFGGMFEPSFFGNATIPFPDMHPTAYIENQAPEPKRSRGPIIRELNSDDENDVGVHDPKKSKGPIIQELDSDDEKEMTEKGKNGNSRKHGRSSKDRYVEDGDDEFQERKSRHLQHRSDYNRSSSIMQQQQQQQQPRNQSFTYHSSTVTYGGANGAYYTSSKTRRTGSDGVTIEESREADTATREATHRLSRGLYNKGHSLTRKLNSDGRVDTMQTLHNLNQDELPVFEEAWNGNARQHLPGWSGNFGGLDSIGVGGSEQHRQVNQGGWALPSNERMQQSGRIFSDAREPSNERMQHSGRIFPGARETSNEHMQHSSRIFSGARERAAGSSHMQNVAGMKGPLDVNGREWPAGSSHMQNVAAMKGSSAVKDDGNYTRWRRE